MKIGTLDKLIYLLSNSSVWFTPNIRDFYCRKTTATLIIIKKENWTFGIKNSEKTNGSKVACIKCDVALCIP